MNAYCALAEIWAASAAPTHTQLRAQTHVGVRVRGSRCIIAQAHAKPPELHRHHQLDVHGLAMLPSAIRAYVSSRPRKRKLRRQPDFSSNYTSPALYAMRAAVKLASHTGPDSCSSRRARELRDARLHHVRGWRLPKFVPILLLLEWPLQDLHERMQRVIVALVRGVDRLLQQVLARDVTRVDGALRCLSLCLGPVLSLHSGSPSVEPRQPLLHRLERFPSLVALL